MDCSNIVNQHNHCRTGHIPRTMVRLAMVLTLAALVPGGCASKERVYENVYEGLKGRERLIYQQDEPIPPEVPSYGQYKSERQRILKENQNNK